MSTWLRPILPSIATLLLLAACSGASSTATPSSTSAAATPVSSATSAVPSAAAPATATPPASTGPTAIPDGTYVTAAIPVSEIDAKINADTKLTAAERADALQGFAGHTTETFKLTLSGSSWTEYDAWDSGTFEVGSRATFASPDTRTIVIQETCCGITNFQVTPSGSGYALKIRTYHASSAEDDLITHMVFETRPFLPVP